MNNAILQKYLYVGALKNVIQSLLDDIKTNTIGKHVIYDYNSEWTITGVRIDKSDNIRIQLKCIDSDGDVRTMYCDLSEVQIIEK